MKSLALAMTVGALALGALTAGPAAADPPSNGCPTGNRASDVDHGILLLAVGDLAPLGYHLPGLLDDPANGGNGDGYVCGIPLGNRTTPHGSQLYDFFDNRGPASPR